jgi:hypothetical protein
MAKKKKPAPSLNDDADLAALVSAEVIARRDRWIEDHNDKVSEEIAAEKIAAEVAHRTRHEAYLIENGWRPPLKLKSPEHLKIVEQNKATINLVRADILTEIAANTKLPMSYWEQTLDEALGAAMALGAFTVDRRERREIEKTERGRINRDLSSLPERDKKIADFYLKTILPIVKEAKDILNARRVKVTKEKLIFETATLIEEVYAEEVSEAEIESGTKFSEAELSKRLTAWRKPETFQWDFSA